MDCIFGKDLTPTDYGLLFFASLGAIIFSSWLRDFFLKGVYGRLFRPDINIKKVYGPWVVVTGATDGIGKALAFEFARKDCNVVLISRSKEKLEHCENEFKKRFPNLEVLTLDVDYSCFNEEARKRVKAFLENLDIGVLVNNVGVSYPFTKYFHEVI